MAKGKQTQPGVGEGFLWRGWSSQAPIGGMGTKEGRDKRMGTKAALRQLK